MEKRHRIRKNIEFQSVYKLGKSYGNRNLVLYIKKNNLDYTRIGFTITKKIGNAVTRNRIRRMLREICRLNFHKIKPGYDLIFISKKNVVGMKYDELEKSVFHILKIAKLFQTR